MRFQPGNAVPSAMQFGFCFKDLGESSSVGGCAQNACTGFAMLPWSSATGGTANGKQRQGSQLPGFHPRMMRQPLGVILVNCDQKGEETVRIPALQKENCFCTWGQSIDLKRLLHIISAAPSGDGLPVQPMNCSGGRIWQAISHSL